MPDFRCPSCRGGFPAVYAADDACPWCGEPMDGADDAPITPSATTTAAVDPIAPDVGRPIRESDLLGDGFQSPEDADSPLDTPPLYDHGLGASTQGDRL